ncbi:uncharacterized protein BXZ73DRAFT_41118 [Epithele typhae]|uniref:uncharacterized protein n=1 Tax=Epithele typhae TaxID=378194 RepID=UPI0020081E78|nr:uncharacterized protein BXZ73DRAFT_41118 [Epithele typhae]KAH9942220.1 hypothetical protein BXZ73DRAFT_41118 [Epithele typhae]
MLELFTLPTELLLTIFAYLPVQALRALRLTSHVWNTFFTENESSIYRHAALQHNFINSKDTLLRDAIGAHPCLDFLQNAPDWYQYCKRYYQLQRNWTGFGKVSTRYYAVKPGFVHRLKVDELHRLLITTHQFGGITVFDLDTGRILWSLDATYIRRNAHCEYENGFLIFDRPFQHQEVWRLESIYSEFPPPAYGPPDARQFAAYRYARQGHPHPSPDRRGHFRPWSFITAPDGAHAYRFVYPDLLICGNQVAWIWDVRTGQRTFELHGVQGEPGQGDINYVELSPRHVFICSTSALRVFSRQTKQCVLVLHSYQMEYANVHMPIPLAPSNQRQGTADEDEVVLLPAEATLSSEIYSASYAEFSALHVSRDGKDVAAQLSDTRILLIRDFERIVRGEIPFRIAALECGGVIPTSTDEQFSTYLSFENGRLGFATTSGIYLATLEPRRHLVDEELLVPPLARPPPPAILETPGLSFPHVLFSSLPFYYARKQLHKVSCLQITETRLFFVWDAKYRRHCIERFRALGLIPAPRPPLEGVGDDEDYDDYDEYQAYQEYMGEHEDDEEGEEEYDDEGEEIEGEEGMELDEQEADDGAAAAQAGPAIAMDEDGQRPDPRRSELSGDLAQIDVANARYAVRGHRNPIVFCIDFSPRD